MPLLEVQDIHVAYGMSQVLFGVSLEVEAGEVIGLLGRNGVGKTTTIRTVMGLNRPRRGEIRFRGQPIAGLEPFRISRLGIGWVPEERRIFPELTTWENLDTAARTDGGDDSWTLDQVLELFPDLGPLRDRKGGFLSGGEQQMLTIARTLMTNPTLLLLDEPSEGLAPLVVAKVHATVARLKAAGLSIVLAEQRLDFVLSLSDRVYILEKGQVGWSGTPAELRTDSGVIDRFLTV
jgi:branched-chain amino acid transport system ATP-binding protein